MLNLIRKIVDNDEAVKLLFDHVRNIGICAVVFGAALWKYNNIGPGYIFFLDVIIIVLLGALAIFLFFVNQLHGLGKLRDAQPRWVVHLVVHGYSVVALTIAYSVAGIRL